MFTYRRKAHYHETDQMGVIHHANYVKWMEEARIAYMDQLGFGYNAVEAAGIQSPVVSIALDYKRPTRFDDEVEVRVGVKAYSGVRLAFDYTFFNLTTGYVCAEATSHHCFWKEGRILSLKKALPELDARFAAEAAREE